MKNLFKSFVTIVSMVFFSSMSLLAQKPFYPTEKGTIVEYAEKNGKGKIESYTRQTITEFEGSDINNCTIYFLHEFFDKNKKREKNQSDVTIPIKIKDGAVHIDFTPLFEKAMREEGQSMEVEANLTGETLDIPSNLQIGQKLKDYTVIFNISAQGMSGQNILTLSNRKVTAQEKITVEAGTFDCYKIEYEEGSVMEMMGMKMNGPKGKVTEWIAREIGPILTERYDNKGKLISKSELVSVSK